MIRNYFKIAYRNLLKNKASAFTYLASLVIGYTGFLIILIILKNELTFDTFHEKSTNIYRIIYVENEKVVKNPRKIVGAGPPAGPVFKDEIPQVKEYVRFRYAENSLVAYNNQSFYEDNAAYVDSSFFAFFSFPLISGNAKDVLTKPNSVVISEKTKNKIFGNENPIGKILKFDNRLELNITGVMHDFPLNSHIDLDYLISFNTFSVPVGYPVTLHEWGWISFPTYLEIQRGADINKVEEECQSILKENLSENSKNRFFVKLQPIKDIYLGEYKYHRDRTGEWSKIIGLILISTLLLGIACFNFINIATARSSNRIKEIGIRKVIGANKQSILKQLVGESVLVSFISMFISVFFVQTLVESDGYFLGINFSKISENFIFYSPLFFLFSIVVGIIAGIYPSLIAASFSPLMMFKNSGSFGGTKSIVKKVIITFQFSLATFLIITSFIISSQMNYITEKNLGFDKEQILVLRLPRENSDKNVKLISDSFKNIPSVINVTSTGNILDGDNGSGPIYPEGFTGDIGIPMNTFGVNFNFFETLDIKFYKGRSFSPEVYSDSSEGIIINQKAAEVFGWENPIGKQLRVSNLLTGKIVGVVNNFHFASLHNEIEPLIMFYAEYTEFIFVKISKGSLVSKINSLKGNWTSVVPNLPFNFFFLDENINKLYKSEMTFLNLINVFSALSVFVSLLGLFGLVFFTVSKKKKEIAVRKILGASVSNILVLISKEFVILTLFANLIAWPLSYYYMNKWLSEFAYRVEVGILYFFVAAFSVSACAFIIVSFVSYRSANSNPVDSLKYE